MASSLNKFTITPEGIETNEEERIKDKKKKRLNSIMTLVQMPEKALLMQSNNPDFIDPNSTAYQQAVLEDKFNKAESKMKKSQLKKLQSEPRLQFGASLREKEYSGNYKRRKEDASPSAYRLNGAFKNENL